MNKDKWFSVMCERYQFTYRQVKILAMDLQGFTETEIAKRLGITIKAVQCTIQSIEKKMNYS